MFLYNWCWSWWYCICFSVKIHNFCFSHWKWSHLYISWNCQSFLQSFALLWLFVINKHHITIIEDWKWDISIHINKSIFTNKVEYYKTENTLHMNRIPSKTDINRALGRRKLIGGWFIKAFIAKLLLDDFFPGNFFAVFVCFCFTFGDIDNLEACLIHQ